MLPTTNALVIRLYAVGFIRDIFRRRNVCLRSSMVMAITLNAVSALATTTMMLEMLTFVYT